MNKNTTLKVLLIAILTGVFIWYLHPWQETLKAGMDIGGGTSFTYEVDTQGLSREEIKGLSSKVITVFRRRIDPANIQNIVWQPQGNTRFEIQVPLASKDARDKRQAYEAVMDDLMAKNINTALIMRSLAKPAAERAADFAKYAEGSAQRQAILTKLADSYDQLNALRKQRDQLTKQMATPESLITVAGLNLSEIESKMPQWTKLDDGKLKEALKAYLGSEGNLDMLTRYVAMNRDRDNVLEQLTNPDTGKNKQFEDAQTALDNLNITQERIEMVLGMKADSMQRKTAIEDMKKEFPERSAAMDKVVAANDAYAPFKGRLDDPKDLQRMMKGAGILEFRILPTKGDPELSDERITEYLTTLQTKGPKAASDDEYAWFEVEKPAEFTSSDKQGRPTITGVFGTKTYVLASNKKDEALLHGTGEKPWKLANARPGRDSMGKRSIDFSMDERGANLFARLTGKNIGKPLAILLDGIAISAPNIQSQISGNGQITGEYSEQQVTDMIDKLNAGSLPARLVEQPISVKTIGPSIGTDNRDRGIKAGEIGLIVTVVFMCLYYTLSGANASIALLLNLLLTLGIMAMVDATFTLPGIAGIILTIGMSVDANVLINERIREEQEKGASLRVAIKNGYQKAFTTILDSNLTTIITALILFWVASEEVKGYAIVLILGIATSMFTALTVTRINFEFLLAHKLIKNPLKMVRMFQKINIDWVGKRPIFVTISVVLVIASVICFFTRDEAKNSKYDIEFIGGTQVQVDFKRPITRQDVEQRLSKVANEQFHNSAIAAANVYSIGDSQKQYEITTTETNKAKTTIKYAQAGKNTVESVTKAIEDTSTKMHDELSNLVVTANSDGTEFTISTNNTNKSMVASVLTSALPGASISSVEVEEVVNEAILAAYSGLLEIKENLKPQITSTEKITEQVVESYPELSNYLGGIKIICKLQTAATASEIEQRINGLRYKLDMQNLNQYPYKILNADMNTADVNEPLTTFAYVSSSPEAGFRQLEQSEWNDFVNNETTKVMAAGQTETSLSKVTQINPSVGKEAITAALIALVLSFLAIIAYVWLRFGELRYGLAAIVALVHDVCVAVGAVTVSYYLSKTAIGRALLIGDFKINMTVVAAFLTIIGYSINDTIVIFDRIRENRHKDKLTPKLINDSVNQTLSRTIITSLTVFFVVLIMYIWGGPALRGFTFAMLIGVIAGSYSTIAVAAPLLLIGKKNAAKKEIK